MGASGNTIGGIKSNIADGECSCFHSVLQCLLMHPVMEICFNNYNLNIDNINNNNNKYPLTFEIIKIYNTIMQRKIANSSNFINLFRNIINQNKNNFENINAYSINTPGLFLYFLLFLLHNELNESPKNFDINLINNISFEQKKNKDSLMEFYLNYITKCHEDSIIFKYFFNTEKIIFNCLGCGMYYDCNIKNIFSIDLSGVNDYRKKIKPNASQINADLYECFDYYCNYKNVICQNCQTNIIRYVRVFNGKTLIITFHRNINGANRKCDVDFPIKFNFSKFTAFNERNMEYVLKGCISYGLISNNNWKYIADVNLDVNNNSQGRWIRYIDSNSYILESSKRIYDYEPQILIYQLNDLEENNNNNININNNQNSGYFYNNFIRMNNAFNNPNNNNNINNNNNLNNNNQFFGNINNLNTNNNNLNFPNNQNFPNSQINNNNYNPNYNELHAMYNNQRNYNEITNTSSLQNNFITNQFN